MKKTKLILILVWLFVIAKPGTVIAQTSDVPWPMAGANPQRTSWVSTTLADNISTQWVKPIYPLVPQKAQVTAAEGKVFVPTSAGLYAFDAATGADVWQFATALPLANSPTYANGVLYFGGMDKKMHAINASNGSEVWSFTADGGFSTNPVVANGMVYAGNRDSYFYAISTSNGALMWRYQTGNQILQSAAFKAEDDGIASTSQGTLYFGSNDSYAYALNAQNGSLIWKSSQKIEGAGIYYWWPVIYGNDIIFTRDSYYDSTGVEAGWFFGSTPNNSMLPGTVGFETQSGYWPIGEKIIDVRTNPNGNTFPDYFETPDTGDTRPQHGPFRRNAFFYNRITGVEHQFDLDTDGKPDGPPMAWNGKGGTHAPPVVSGYNNVLYFNSVIRGLDGSHGGVSIFGWKVGTPTVDITVDTFRPGDEPMAISAAGDKVYWNHCCDRNILGVNISRPNTDNSTDPAREWYYTNGGGIDYFAWPLAMNGLPNTQSNYYYNEAVKFFWNPQPNFSPPCCSAVFFNNNPVGPAVLRKEMVMNE